MDLGIAGKTAIVCGASKGLGRGVAQALAGEGVNVVLVARTAASVEAAAREIAAATGAGVEPVAADVTTQEGRDAILAACPRPDILVNNAGGPPPGDFRKLRREDWIKALDANMLSAIDMISRTLDPMIERKFGRILNITSSMVKQPTAILSLSNGARAGLTGYVGGIAREIVQHNVTINSVLPGQFDTDRLVATQRMVAAARNMAIDDVRASAIKNIPAGRFGTSEEFGAVCAFLCSVHASYITAANVLLDGGLYPGLL